MDKKQNARIPSAKGQVCESRKSLDVSVGKQCARNNGRRRESTSNFSSSKSEQKHNNNNNNKQPAYKTNSDKRFTNARGDGYQRSVESSAAAVFTSGSGLVEENSVFLHGSKKKNITQMININLPSRYPSSDVSSSASRYGYNNRHHYVKKVKYNKEQFLQATCQFVVKSDIDLVPYTVDPDTLVDWNFIEQVNVQQTAEESQCPICLYSPVAGKMTRCGHIYCWPCILHYLALSDKTWRKCPICYDAIHIGDLKSATSKPQKVYSVGDLVELQLMRREKGSMFVRPATNLQKNAPEIVPHLFGDYVDLIHSKLVLADPHEILTIIERERNELKCQLSDEGPDCPESMFVQQSLDLLEERQNIVLKSMKKSEKNTPQPSDLSETLSKLDDLNLFDDEFAGGGAIAVTSSPKFSALTSTMITENIVIDEENNITLNDIDITTPTMNDAKQFLFYQAVDGQNLYLHSINVRMLQMMYGSLDRAPAKFAAKIIQKETCSMTENIRKRCRYLQHLPVTSQFEVVEVRFVDDIVSDDVFSSFREDLQHRQRMRQRRAKEERKRERHIEEVNDRQIGKIIAQGADIDVTSEQHFPMVCGSYETKFFANDPPLTGIMSSSLEQSAQSSVAAAGPSFARMVTTTQKTDTYDWPTLTPTKLSLTFSDPLPPSTKYININGGQNLQNRFKQLSESDDGSSNHEDDLMTRVPEFKQSFGSAIAEALEKSANKNGGSKNSSASGGGKGKKKNKKTILFSTGGRSFNGN